MNVSRPKPDEAHLSGELRGRRFEIVDIIPPRPGSVLGTIVMDDSCPVRSISVSSYWLRATHARIGGTISFLEPAAIRYHWEDLPPELQKAGVMDDLKRG